MVKFEEKKSMLENFRANKDDGNGYENVVWKYHFPFM